MAYSSAPSPVCFNSTCKEELEVPKQGWRRRTGGYADLCDRCASAYKEGRFCDTFHINTSGWRCCESCGKQIHCGCIVSFHLFILLDAGGIECIDCAKTDYILRPNPAWPAPSHSLPAHAERIKDISAKNWSSIAGSGPVPWRQAPRLFSASTSQPELPRRMPFEVNVPGGIDRPLVNERLSASSLDKRKSGEPSERLMNGILRIGTSEVIGDRAIGTQYDGQRNLFGNVSQQSSFLANEPSTPPCGLPMITAAKVQTTDQNKVSGVDVQQSSHPQSAGKIFANGNGIDSSLGSQPRNGKPRGETRYRSPLLPRYWPRITDQELQLISGDSNSKITPLFEKVLSPSDAGRIGRLVLPKKCAETYLPPISEPEGLPLIVQDLKGKEWMFQFRFWPNNNSRMYVLEGVTPCIQSMHLQAGDTVTFSRLEPEGKLVMGFRKSSIASPSDQGTETANTSNGVSTHGDPSTQHHQKGSMASTMSLPINQGSSKDLAIAWSEVDKSAYIAKETVGGKVSICAKRRKPGKMGSNSKRLKLLDNEEMLELNLTIEQVQGLLRPPPSNIPTVFVIEGIEFEDYQDAPIIGRPTIFATNLVGENIRWAQCEDCLKWRKVPANASLPSRWTCSENSWDPERSLCSVEEELTPEQLENMLPMISQASSKRKKPDQEPVEGLDALADLAIQDREAFRAASQATTKHPRHRPGCTCIVCMQPPSGSKHKSTCVCNVCLTVKRRFQTMMSRRGQRQSEKEAESARNKQTRLPDDDAVMLTETENGSPNQSDDDPNKRRSSTSPFRSQNIDLNIQPEREEEPLPVSVPMGMMRLIQESTQRYIRQQKSSINGAGGRNYENGNHENTDL